MRLIKQTSPQPVPIAFCITELNPGGAERALVQLVTRLNRDLWTPHVICLGNDGALCEPLRSAGIPVTCLNAQRHRPFRTLFRLCRELRRIRPALLQTYLFHANILGRIAGRLAGVPHVVSGIRVAERRNRWYLRADRWTERLVAAHVCVSQSVLEFSRHTGGLSDSKLHCIPNGVAVEQFALAEPLNRSALGLQDDDALLLTVARLDPQKGLLDLLTAAATLAPRQPQLKWLIAGEGTQRTELQTAIDRAGLTETVLLLGQRDDIPRLLKSADLFVFPSRWEGMPNVILEAVAASLPIVSTDVEGVRELLEPDGGIIVPVGNPAALSTAVEQMLHCSAPFSAPIAQARIRTHYTWDQTARRYEELYLQLLAEPHDSPR